MTRTAKAALCAHGLALTISVLLVMTSAASAVQSKPFGVVSFTMQTIEHTKEVVLSQAGPESRFEEFVNEPYVFTQAAGHPWGLTTTLEFTSERVLNPRNPPGGKFPTLIEPTQDPKDVAVDLPPGLLGDPQAVPRCPLAVVLSEVNACPSSAQVGMAAIHYKGGYNGERVGIINVTPEAGQSAEFVLPFLGGGFALALTAHVVHSPAGGYGLTVVDNGIPMTELLSAELTFWGVPADSSHDPERGLECETSTLPVWQCYRGGESSGVAPVPFLTMPADCAAGPLTATVKADSWEEPGRYLQARASLPGATGCDALRFDPSIEVQTDTTLADEPMGLGVNLQVPQAEQPDVPGTPQLRDAVVTLPEGVSISPGVVDGVQACDESGPEGINFNGPESEETGLNGELQLAAGHCPDASIVGTAEAITPLLPEPVKGHVYLARPGCGGAGQAACTEQDALNGNLYKLYLELGGVGPLADTGVNLKVAGEVEANPATGQLTTKFLENPQLPFSELKIHLNGGPRAPLDTPETCGPAVTTADFTPWSAPGTTPEGVFMPGTADAAPSSFFDVSGCASSPGLSPGFAAGTVTPLAGQFSAFTLNLSRQDREQDLAGIQVHTPPGLLGMLSSVPLCGEPQAAQGSCPAASKIGTTRVASGAGSHPFEIGGNVYLTSGYAGAPFGLSIVTNAVAGPFDLGLVVVRARIDVDRETSALTITSDPLPQIVFGVPLRLQRVTVDIDRPGFMFNPTSCAGRQITATISGAQDATANVASPFAVGACRSLAFKPQFRVSTSGRTSRVGGASLDVRLSYPANSMGSEANIARVKVELPKQLPSRLTTLQKACPAATFEADPARCSAASVVGVVKASTPLLPVGLTGPVYFVSHGGEAFPSLVVVLQGDGVRVDLTGSTFISKAGITSSTFKTVPDVPVNTFELYLPEGPYSALAANGSLCAASRTATPRRARASHARARTGGHAAGTRAKVPPGLSMPTEMVAQNGAVLDQNTKIEVTGCATTKAKSARTTTQRPGKAGSRR
jgi:hypothetical protein